MDLRDAANRDLLFGLLALQNGLIDTSMLVAAFQAWTRNKSRPIADLLIEQGAIDAEDRGLIEGLANKHLSRHGDNVERSLTALDTGKARLALGALGDVDLEATLGHFAGSGSNPTAPGKNSHTGETISVGDIAGDGRRFRLLRPHARGGLGEVFVALDGELNREVALKQILQHHADEPSRRTRFLIEAEITGGLEHPGIVPVYGLGRNADGRPYYAMRFIRGDTLREAIAAFHGDKALKSDPGKRALALRRLLRRFVDVCNAIDYAHARGVIHRDLKPANVIVGKHGETLVVDWGLAKAMGKPEAGAVDERTLMPSSASGSAETMPGSAIGTPSYMSPEQARGDLEAIGPKSDVYSLGASLFCLLTGKAPFEGSDIGSILRDVRKGTFSRPREIDPSIDPALQAVCLKAMATEPDDRYSSCRALAEDVERWSADEPVTAYREPQARRARRWARRNRTLVTATAATLVAGVLGLSAVAAVQARSNLALTRANGETRKALNETREAQKATAAALKQSENSREQAEAVGHFLVDAFRRPDPSTEGKDVKVADVLDQALEGLSGEFSGTKAVQGALLDALGRSYHGLGLYPRAEEAHRKAWAIREAALGPDHLDTIISRNNLAVTYLAAGRTTEAMELYEATLKLAESSLGPDHSDTLATRGNLAVCYLNAGRITESVELQEATLKLREEKLGPEHPSTLTGRNNLADAYRAAGRTDEAVALFESTLKLFEARHGPEHPDTLALRGSLATAYLHAGRIAQAIAMEEATLKLREQKLGPDHPDTLASRNNLATNYLAADRTTEAVALHETTLKLLEAKLGADHPRTLASGNNLASAYAADERPAEAVALHEKTLKLKESKLGLDHPSTLITRANLALGYRNIGRVADSIALNETTLKLIETKLGAGHPNTLASRNNLAVAYFAAGRTAEAVALHEANVKLLESILGPAHPNTLTCRNSLAVGYERQGRWTEAEALFRETLARRRGAEKPDNLLVATELANLGRNLLKQSKPLEAEPFLRECLAIRIEAMPDDYRRYSAESQLGCAFFGQGKFAEAEPLIVGGFKAMQAREAKIAASLRYLYIDAREAVVQLYKVWGKPELASAWAIELGLAELPKDVFAH